jgi:hypothetical protein
MKIHPADLEKSGYIFLEKLNHFELLAFLNEQNKSKGLFFNIYLVCLIIPIPFLSYFLTLHILRDDIAILEAILFCLLGIGLVLIFIPVHELLHALGYQLIGAKNISYFANLKRFYFATISDKSVINLVEFKIVALMPFLTVLICAISLFPFVDIEWQIATLSFVATHNLFCGGDFSLLNYLQNNKHQGIVTYDDKEKKETYFYVEK